jgi:plasmanylethanolamine desaturase
MPNPRSYDYSPVHRTLEIAGIAGLPVLLGMMIFKASHGLDGDTVWLWPSVVAVVLAGYLAADFISGFVHFLGDTYGDETTKVIGPGFIKPFRDHHVDQTGICRHDFIEINGNNCLVCIPVGLVACWLIPADTNHAAALVLLLLASMMVWVFMTNQFHKWAHEDNPPPLVSQLQSMGLILPPDHHAIHHRAPHDSYYCITVGWLNPILSKLHFFEAVRRVVAWFLPAHVQPAADDTSVKL